MTKKNWGITLAFGAILTAGLWWYTTRPQPITVAITAVERGDVAATVSNTRAGTVKTCNRARLAPMLGGQIASLAVEEGDSVVAGQALLTLWNADSRAQLLLARMERTAAEARVEEACTAAALAKRESERSARLHKQQMISEEKADVAQADAVSRAAVCRAMSSMVDVSQANIELAEARVEQTIIRAPFAGIVAEINGEVGEVITPSPVGVATLPAIDLIDASCMLVSAPIDEVDAPAIEAGMAAEVFLDAYPARAFPASVKRVAPYVMEREKQARTVEIEVSLENSTEALLAGYSADVEVTVDLSENTLFVPTQSIIAGDHVLVLTSDGILENRTIRTGLRNWQVTEVLEGLTEQERVVLSVDRVGVQAGAHAVAE